MQETKVIFGKDAFPEKHSCGKKLEYSPGVIGVPEHLFCPSCMDYAFEPITGEIIAPFE